MTILITGGLGFIGSHTVTRILEHYEDVLIIDRNCNPQLIQTLENISQKKIQFMQVDLLNKRSLQQLFERYTISSVIHFAALKSLPESYENPLTYYNNNLISTLNLLDVMQTNNVKRLVFSSSAIIYGNSLNTPILEEEPVVSNNPYAQTKMMAEQILKDIVQSDPTWSVLALRYFNPIGAHPSGVMGEKMTERSSNLMSHIIRVAAKEQTYLSVFGNTYDSHDGTCIRDYIHVMDLADGHVKALHYIENHHGFEVINLGTGVGYSVLDLIHTFMRVNDIDVPYKIEAQRKGDIAKSYASVKKAAQLLNWRAERTLEDMCKDAWRWKVRQKQQ